MSKTVHSLKLTPYDAVDLNRLAYAAGDVVYDATNQSLRLMDGATVGGFTLITQKSLNTTLTSTLSLYVSSTSLTTTLGNYATNTALTNAVSGINTTLTNTYVSNTSLATTLGSYVTSSSLTTTLGSYVTSSNLTTTLSSYVTSSNLTTTLTGYVTTTNANISVTGTAGGTAVPISTNSGTLTFASNNGITVGIIGTTITISSPQDLRTTAAPTFANATIGGVNIKPFAVAMAAALS